jgi:hypothetical protein
MPRRAYTLRQRGAAAMNPSPHELAEILSSGGSLRLHSEGLSDAQLLHLGMHAKGRGLLTIVVNSALSHATMVQIAAKGDGSVTFDLTG